MLPKRYIAIKNNPRWLPPTLLMWALGPGALHYSTQKGLFMSLSLLCSIHKRKDTRNRLDVRQADQGTRQGRGLTLMTLSLCLRSEHSVTWNVLPWRRRVSRRSLTKPSSLFSTPRKKRKAAPSATAAVQLSEVARDPSPCHPEQQSLWPSSSQKRRARPERTSCVPRPGLCPASSPAQHPVSHCHIPRPEHPHCARRMPSHIQTVPGRCWKQVTIVLYFTSPFHRCKWTGSHGGKAKHSVLHWWPYFTPLPNLEIQCQHSSWDCCLSRGSSRSFLLQFPDVRSREPRKSNSK